MFLLFQMYIPPVVVVYMLLPNLFTATMCIVDSDGIQTMNQLLHRSFLIYMVFIDYFFLLPTPPIHKSIHTISIETKTLTFTQTHARASTSTSTHFEQKYIAL